jgi:calcium-dependent protein kinase
MSGSFDFKGRRWKRLSPQSKEFVRSLLVVDPEERSDAEEALSAVWLNKRMTATVRNPHEDEIEGARHSMVKYAKYSKLKKMALMVVAHKSSTSEIGILRKIFQKYDTKKDGQLSYEEFRAALVDAGYEEKECEDLFRSVDLDGTGTVRYTEFLAATIEAQGGT